MEETTDDQIENGAASRSVSAALFCSGCAAVFCAFRAVLFAARVRVRRPDARGRQRRYFDGRRRSATLLDAVRVK